MLRNALKTHMGSCESFCIFLVNQSNNFASPFSHAPLCLPTRSLTPYRIQISYYLLLFVTDKYVSDIVSD